MESIFHDFQSLFKGHFIQIQNKYLDDIFQEFSFHLFVKGNNNEKLISLKIDDILKVYQENGDKNILILEYIEKNQRFRFNSDFFFLCFEKTLIIIEKSEIKWFYTFLLQNKGSKIYCLSDQFKIINQNENLQLKLIENQQLKHEIRSFTQKFSEKKNKNYSSQFKKVNNLFTLVKKAISGILIIKSYNKKIEYDRVFHYKEYQEENRDKNIDEESYIILRYLDNQKVGLIYDIKQEELFTLKIFFNDREPEKAIELFERERNNYLNIHHPLFPKYLGFSQIFSNNCIVIEYIEGNSLDKIHIKKFNIEIKLKIIFQILVAFDYLHYKGFIYRDLKPNNIIFNDNGSITIIDFDRMIDNTDDQSTKDFGHKYIAPEFDLDKKFTMKSDIYSIGKIIEFVFEEEFSQGFNSEYSKLHEICEQCKNKDETKRPNISDLVRSFYMQFISKKVNIKDNEIIQSIDNIEDKNYFYFWFYISEYDHQVSQNILKINNKTDFLMEFQKLNQITQRSNNNEYSDFYSKIGVMQDDNGKLIPQDVNKLINYLASEVDSESQYVLGLLYEAGCYVPKDINKSIYYFSIASDKNHLEAQLNLGFLYYNGDLIPQDINKAIHYFSLAANNNHSKAQFILGLLYAEGNFIPRNINKAIYYFSSAANQNNSEAQFYLGYTFYKSQLVPCDINKAIHYFTLAANQNHSKAQYNLGLLYAEGNFIPQDINKAIYYFSLAANQNNSEAQFYLGYTFYKSKLVPCDINKAIHYFTLAANQNHLKAQLYLGSLYAEGNFIPQDINKAIYYFSLAANQNNSEAQFYLGYTFYKSKLIPCDINKAIHYFTLAANQNHLKAQFYLGLLYDEGKLIPQDINQAIHYYTLAADNNFLLAQFRLGIIYIEGILIKKDIQKSIHYFTLAADQNYSEAQNLLAYIYYESTLIPSNINKSIYYFTQAAKQNNTNSQYHLGCIYYDGKYIARDINKSIYYFKLAADQNNIKAQFKLGHLYYDGKFIPPDINTSIYYFTQAAKQNNKRAQYYLGYIYFNGNYIQRDIKKSIHYFSLAADQNDLEALHALGLLYYDGTLIPQDINKAIHYLTLAADQNHPNSQYGLGYIYFNDKNVPRNINRAIHYYTLASKQNDAKSLMVLGFLYYSGMHFPKDFNRSIYYFTLAAENNYYEANYYLGCIYCQMNNFNMNVDKVIKYFKECSSFNHQYSKNNLGLLYKNIKRNEIAIEYFEEAIRQKNDKVAMYNLGHAYFYGKFVNEDIDKSIELFIKSSKQNFGPSKLLLCLAIIKKISCIDFNKIKEELEKHGIMETEFHLSIYEFIHKYGLDDLVVHAYDYQMYEHIEFFYNFDKKAVKYNDFIITNQVKKEDNLRHNITAAFYEGFSLNGCFL